uniref:Uncharacterized protein n=1 Tax=Trichobilharzia regenti TaxID=157069 RepID=A0AA85J0V8_TRIRE|nr:unnamed protein product [Trichobilharzia regenti]
MSFKQILDVIGLFIVVAILIVCGTLLSYCYFDRDCFRATAAAFWVCGIVLYIILRRNEFLQSFFPANIVLIFTALLYLILGAAFLLGDCASLYMLIAGIVQGISNRSHLHSSNTDIRWSSLDFLFARQETFSDSGRCFSLCLCSHSDFHSVLWVTKTPQTGCQLVLSASRIAQTFHAYHRTVSCFMCSFSYQDVSLIPRYPYVC